jgi:hypothetical protein
MSDLVIYGCDFIVWQDRFLIAKFIFLQKVYVSDILLKKNVWNIPSIEAMFIDQ